MPTASFFRDGECAAARVAMFYNFCRIHKALLITPAMEAGFADLLSEVTDIVALLKVAEAQVERRWAQ